MLSKTVIDVPFIKTETLTNLGKILDPLQDLLRSDRFGRLVPLTVDPRKEDGHGLAVCRIQSDVLKSGEEEGED